MDVVGPAMPSVASLSIAAPPGPVWLPLLIALRPRGSLEAKVDSSIKCQVVGAWFMERGSGRQRQSPRHPGSSPRGGGVGWGWRLPFAGV
eukprot:scaffold58725_cov31-Tisochrysis_lutea.AAC.6